MTHVDPRRGEPANVYVQVRNKGLAPAEDVRVVALYADASAGVPPLPADFWTSTAVPGASGCGALDGSTGWTMIGCGTLDEVNQRIPEVQKFSWDVPAEAAEHTCVLTVVDSAADPITNTTTDAEALTISDRHVAHRNLHVIDGPSANPAACVYDGSPAAGGSPERGAPFSGLSTLLVPNRWDPAGSHDVLLSRSGMESSGRLAFLLPSGVASTVSGLPRPCGLTLAQFRLQAGPNDRLISIALPRAGVLEGFALSANGELKVDGLAKVTSDSEGWGALANAGDGKVWIGAGSQVGSISARGRVDLLPHSRVRGDVLYEDDFRAWPFARVTGDVQQTTALSPPDTVSWVVQLPTSSGGDQAVTPGQTLSLPPGRYGHVRVRSGTLRLSGGTYFFDSLEIDSKVAARARPDSGADRHLPA